jgi:hypothetical protein
MGIEEPQPVHHPGIEPIAGMAGNLAHDVQPISQPLKLVPRGDREDCRLAIFALIAVLGYVLAIESETRFRVVW